MIETLRDRVESREVFMLHGVSYADDLAWCANLEAIAASNTLPLRYVPTISQPEHYLGRHGLEAVGPFLTLP